jgi:hypothetical protein
MRLRSKRAALLSLAPAAALLVAIAGAGPVHAVAATITVTGFGDGAGECADATHCDTIRGALDLAHDGDTILLPAGTYTVAGPVDGEHAIEIDKAVTILGAGSGTTIIMRSCGTLGRIFTVDTGTGKSVTISGVTLTGGHVRQSGDDDGESAGGAVLVSDSAQLTLSHDVITGNQASGNGGGVAVHDDRGSLVVLDTVISNNAAGSDVACVTVAAPKTQSVAVKGDGGGIWADGPLSVTSSTVATNTASHNGGGIWLSAGDGVTTTLTQVFIHDNSAMATGLALDIGGGGVYDEVATGGTLNIVHSTISDNHATHGNGGGTYEDHATTKHDDSLAAPKVGVVAPRVAPATPVVNITATTFSGNTAVGNGGGSYVHGSTVTFTNDTYKGNSASNGGAIAAGAATGPGATLTLEQDTIDANAASAGHGGGLWLNHATATLHNTILVANTISPPVTPALENCLVGAASSLISNGYNLSDDTTCNLTKPGDQTPPLANAALGALQGNGGPVTGAGGATSPTLTQLLGLGSTALNLGDPASFAAEDERTVTRPQAARADIGAVEMGLVPTVLGTPTPSSGPAGAVQGIISVPSTGGGDTGGLSPLTLALVAGLLSCGIAAVVMRRRRASGSSPVAPRDAMMGRCRCSLPPCCCVASTACWWATSRWAMGSAA